ncbi:hypothetical protein BRC81_04800 [Halobacteriales archaeon QS_1_68_20]|nr:MAG: hypothetical protein BRC81_04800 [Halobacteriales archaeon QS_1_68_20]
MRDEHQEELQDAAWDVIQSQSDRPARRKEFVEQRDGRDDRGEYWEFEFVDDRDVNHVARLYLDDSRIVYTGDDG